MPLLDALVAVWQRRLVVRLTSYRKITVNNVVVKADELRSILEDFLDHGAGVNSVVVDIEKDFVRNHVTTLLHEIRQSGKGLTWTSLQYNAYDDNITSLKSIVNYGHLTEIFLKNVGDVFLLPIKDLTHLKSFEWSQRAVNQGPLIDAYSIEQFGKNLTSILRGKPVHQLKLGHLHLLETEGLIEVVESLDLSPASLHLKVKKCQNVCMATFAENMSTKVKVALVDLELHTRGHTDFGIDYCHAFSDIPNLKRVAFYQRYVKPEEDLFNMMTAFATNIDALGGSQTPLEWFHLALRSGTADILHDCMYTHRILKKVSEYRNGKDDHKSSYEYKAKVEQTNKHFLLHVRLC